MNKKVLIFVGLILGSIFVGWFFLGQSLSDPITTGLNTTLIATPLPSTIPSSEISNEPEKSPTLFPSPSPVLSLSPSPISGLKIISWEEIRRHNNSQSCYTAIRGYVYDLTNFMPMHGGGEEAIQKICGRDGTDDFVEQHGGSPKQESLLEKMKIGKIQ